MAKHYNLARAERMLERATPTAWSRGLDRLPQGLKDGLPYKPFGRLPVLRRVPLLSIPLTAAGIGSHAVGSGVSSLVAGAVVGSAIGGPVGLVVGAVVGAGVGFVVDEWGADLARGADDLGRGVRKAGNNVADGIGDGFSRIRETLDGP